MPTAVEQFNGREGETATFLSRCLFALMLRVGGFAPRQLSRCAAAKAEEVYHSETFGKTGTDFVRFE